MSCLRGRRSRRPALQTLDRLKESKAVKPLDEVDDVAVGSAAEAAESVGDTADGEGGSAVLVEGTAPDETASLSTELNSAVRNDLFDGVGASRRVEVPPGRGAHSSGPALAAVVVRPICRVTSRANSGAGMWISESRARRKTASTEAVGMSNPMTAYSSQVASYA